MDNKIKIKQVLLWILVAVGLSFLIAYVDRDQDPPPVQTLIPPPPDNSMTWYYDFNEEVWKNIYRTGSRAKGDNSSSRPSNIEEADIQEYLEKKVDGYLEDTYWGEEYDITDKED